MEQKSINNPDSSGAGYVKNNFVFHSNEEFVNFQRCFVMSKVAPYEPIYVKSEDTDMVFHPASSTCDHICLTFMYNGGKPYQIINNKAFYFKGFKKIVIQGERSERSNRKDIPVLEVVNEYAEGAPTNKDSNGEFCHSYDCDDAIFNIKNEHNAPVDIVVSDIAFRVAFKLKDVLKPRDFQSATLFGQTSVGSINDSEVSDGKTPHLHNRWYHPDICPVFFKVYEASSFKMFNVRMYSQYLDLTHVFLHWCENVDITNCEFVNYNARIIGGNIWMCQRVKNVNIVNNDFYKYGNDENIGIWGDSIMNRDEEMFYASKDSLSGLDDEAYANRKLDFEHIHIKNNRFYYGKPQVSPYTGEVFPDHIDLKGIQEAQKNIYKIEYAIEKEWGGVIDIFHSMFFSQHTPKTKIRFDNNDVNSSTTGSSSSSGSEFDGQCAKVNTANGVTEYAIVPYVHYTISDYVVDGNEFYIDSPMNVLMGMTCDNYCRTEGVKITNNFIKYGSWAHHGCQLQDFKIIYDKNPDYESTGYGLEMTNKKVLSPVLIENNTIESAAYPYMVYNEKGDETHIVLIVESGSVEFNHNVVSEDSSEVQETIAKNVITNGDSKVIPTSGNFGYMLLYSRDKGGNISMKGNVFRGMKCMGSFDFVNPETEPVGGAKFPIENKSLIRLNAKDNVFQGCTSINSKNLKECIFNFNANKFFATCDQLILNELPERSLLTLTNNVFRRLANAGSGSGLLYYHNVTKPIGNPSLTLLSSGNKFQSVSGHICEYYDGADINIYSSDEVCLDDDYYEAKSEYFEDH